MSVRSERTAVSELVLVYHTVRHNLGYSSMDCANKLAKNIFVDSELAKKMHCVRTKAESIIKNVLAPRSVCDFLEVLSDPEKCITFFSVASDASNYKNRKVFPVVIRYFDPFAGIRNKLLDFVEQADEAASGIYTLIKIVLNLTR